MANKVSNFSDLIQRVTASCLLHPLAAGRQEAQRISENRGGDESEDENYGTEEEEEGGREGYICQGAKEAGEGVRTESVIEMETLIGHVFEAVSAMKRAYMSLQEAHCPWDADKMRLADVAVVAELRRLAVFRERFRRSLSRESGGGAREGRIWTTGATLREVVVPYEAAVEELKKEVKAKDAEVEHLREKLKTATSLNGSSGRRGKPHQSKRRASCSQTQGKLTTLTLSLSLGLTRTDRYILDWAHPYQTLLRASKHMIGIH